MAKPRILGSGPKARKENKEKQQQDAQENGGEFIKNTMFGSSAKAVCDLLINQLNGV